MTKRKEIIHPTTKVKKTCCEWAREYKIPQSTMGGWFKTLPVSQVFEALDAGKRPMSQGAPFQRYKSPLTEEIYTVAEWAAKLDYHPNYLRTKIKRGEVILVKVDDDEKIFNSLDPDKAPICHASTVSIKNAQKNNALLCVNPLTGCSLPAYEWAKIYGVSIHEFYQAMTRYGRNSQELYMHFTKQKTS